MVADMQTQQAGGTVVAVTGATGFVGRHLVRELLRRGHRVRALVRDHDKALRVLPRKAMDEGRLVLVEGDVLDEGVAARLVKGAGACCHLIGIIREAPGRQTFERLHVRATEAVLAACEAEGAGAMRYCHMSALGVRDEGISEYQKTKFRAEQAVRLSRTDWTIFRPGLIHGADGEFMQMARGWAMGRSAPWLFVPYFTRPAHGWAPPALPRLESPVVQPVRVEDVAWAFAEALGRPETVGEVYNLVGPERISMRDLLKLVRDEIPLGKKSLPLIGIPGQLAAIKARGWKIVGLRDAMPFDEGMARMGSEDSVAELGKARAELGFAPEPFTPSFRAYAAGM
jgi:NADH dehydrogenase